MGGLFWWGICDSPVIYWQRYRSSDICTPGEQGFYRISNLAQMMMHADDLTRINFQLTLLFTSHMLDPDKFLGETRGPRVSQTRVSGKFEKWKLSSGILGWRLEIFITILHIFFKMLIFYRSSGKGECWRNVFAFAWKRKLFRRKKPISSLSFKEIKPSADIYKNTEYRLIYFSVA